LSQNGYGDNTIGKLEGFVHYPIIIVKKKLIHKRSWSLPKENENQMPESWKY